MRGFRLIFPFPGFPRFMNTGRFVTAGVKWWMLRLPRVRAGVPDARRRNLLKMSALLCEFAVDPAAI